MASASSAPQAGVSTFYIGGLYEEDLPGNSKRYLYQLNGQVIAKREVATVEPTATPTNTPTHTPTSTPTPLPKTALLVAGSATLNTADNAVKNRLQTLGFSVTVKDDDVAVADDANGKTLMLTSATVDPTKVDTKFRTKAVPLLNWENALLGDLGMTGTTSGTHYGTATGQTQVKIVDPSHPMAAGKSGNVTGLRTRERKDDY